MLLRIALLFALPMLVLADTAEARCREARDLERLAASLRSELACRAAALRGPGAGACPASSAPACARAAQQEIVELVLGDASIPMAADAARCQAKIARVTSLFVDRRIAERARGERRAHAAKTMRALLGACDGVTVRNDAGGKPIPRLGGACRAAIGTEGAHVSGDAVLRCLRPSLERVIDDVAPAPLRPNVVLVLTDDQRSDTLFYQPGVAELARHGLIFTNAFATTPSCSPSRASIYSGRYAHHHGVVQNGLEAELDPTRTVATWLQAAGYTTGFFGKYMNDAGRLGAAPPPGWSDWRIFLDPSGGSYSGFALLENGALQPYSPDEYSTDVLADRVTEFIRGNAGRPFFAVYAPFAPHAPADPAPRHRGSFAGLPPWRPPNWHEPEVNQKPIWVQFLKAITGEPSTIERDALRIRELESLRAVDEAVRRISEALERAGIADHTLVVYTSDHGVHWGEHWIGTKFSAYEESIRVPYVVRYPLLAPLGGVRDEIVLNLDLAPTFAALAGATSQRDVDGRSLVPLLERAGAPWRDDFLIENPGEIIAAPSQAVRTKRWKYIETATDEGIDRELYDLAADPYELENLAFDAGYADARQTLAARLDVLRRR